MDLDLREYTTNTKRRYVRFNHNRGKSVRVETFDVTGQTYQLDGLIVDESFGGIRLLLISEYQPLVDQICYVRVEGVGTIKAKVVWFRDLLNNGQLNLGLKYLNF